jgi:quercetin dioxygenase-like cupin family protein
MRTILFSLILMMACQLHSFAQHHTADQTNAMTFAPVISQQLSDVDLKDYRTDCSVMTIIPGGKDTVAHRHDAELFGYVLHGSVRIGLGNKAPEVFRKGQMFYEERNILHYLAENSSSKDSCKILLFFIIKKDRAAYTPVFSK